MIYLHKPDILLLTETPMQPHHGALTHVLRNRNYKTHYIPVNSPPPPPQHAPGSTAPNKNDPQRGAAG